MIVSVQIHFLIPPLKVNVNTFRRKHIGEAFEILLPLEQQRVGVGTCCRQEACKPKYQS